MTVPLTNSKLVNSYCNSFHGENVVLSFLFSCEFSSLFSCEFFILLFASFQLYIWSCSSCCNYFCFVLEVLGQRILWLKSIFTNRKHNRKYLTRSCLLIKLRLSRVSNHESINNRNLQDKFQTCKRLFIY